MKRLTKRTQGGIAYIEIADTLPKEDQEIEGSKAILEGIYAVFQKLADYEDTGLVPEEVVKNQKEVDRLRKTLKEQCDYITRISSQIHVKTGFEL
jgi:hypothetical protein